MREIARLYDPRTAAVRVGAEARESWLKAEASRYRILHLATHGVLDDASPLYSELVLAAPAAGEHDDGLLEAREILDLDLGADLAVLSACETGRGRAGAGEGLIGMTWAFFVAGCPATVASQWKVEAASTNRLMLAFHRELRSGARPRRRCAWPPSPAPPRGPAASVLLGRLRGHGRRRTVTRARRRPPTC